MRASSTLLTILTATAACTASDAPDAFETDDSAETDGTVQAPGDPYAFSFVAIADPHVTRDDDHAERLRRVVAWIDDQAEARDVRFVVILGDIAWRDGYDLTLDILDELPVPWVPVAGDNPIQSGEEEIFHDAFSAVWADLSDTLPGFVLQPTPVDNPIEGGQSWLHNLSFSYEGVRFVGLDLNARVLDKIQGEMADLHDFDGGTLPFLRKELGDLVERPADGLVMMTHEPMVMMPGGFDLVEFDTVSSLTSPWADTLTMNLAGHLHVDADIPQPEAGFDVHILDATWDDAVRFGVLDVAFDGRALAVDLERVEID